MLFMVTHPKRMSRSSLLCNGVVDGILHQAVANDAESEDSKKQIQKSGVAGISFDAVTAFTHLIHPVEAVDAASNKRQQKYHTAGSSIWLKGKDIDLVV